jgi:DsbC/DsbD-like thiol-disulfide interchange protein/cytochrome c biogenesis protein CcdA
MLPRRLLSVFLALAAFASGLTAQHVTASLVATEASVQSGRPITVAIRLEHDAHWHTYWLNPGTGYPTSIAWQLPPGWTAGEIQWPSPRIIRDSKGNITGNGYEGVTYLPITLTPPVDLKPGESVALSAQVDWLMCADVCIPGDARVALTLPIRAEPPTPATGHGAEAAASLHSLPDTVPGWEISATRSGALTTLRLTAGAEAPVKDPANLWFFAADGFIQYDKPQNVRRGAAGEILLDLPISDSADQTIARLTGVLTSSGSWLAGGALPGLRIDVPLVAAAIPPSALSANAAPAASTSLLGTLALAFVGGLILNLMPCVFPVLGIKILGFVNQSGNDRRLITLHGVAFTVGVLLSFWALAGALAVLRAGGDQLGWGFQLQSPAFVFGLAAVMLVFALSMSGVFEFGLGATGVGANLQMKDGYSGSFFTGVLATIVATPCSAPFLAPALGAALALPTAESFVVFTTIALGLSVPYLLLSIFPQAVKVLPRPGAWMETFKQAMAFPLYATVGYLVWVLAGQTTESGLLMTLLGLTVIAMAAWLYGRYHAPGSTGGRMRFGLIGGLALLTVGGWLGWPRAAAPTDLVWEAWSPERVTELRAQGRTVYVDFTARWCATCQTNKKVVFSSAEVLATFADRNVVALKADWTNQDARITAELAKWNRSAIPFNLIYRADRPEPQVLPELLTPQIVLDALTGPASRTN